MGHWTTRRASASRRSRRSRSSRPRRPKVATDPTILAALDAVVAAEGDSSIYGNPAYVNYETSAALATLAAARAGPYGAAQARRATGSPRASSAATRTRSPSAASLQEGRDLDLSNLQFMIRALHDAGLPARLARLRACRSTSRVQNRSVNTAVVPSKGATPVDVVSGDDGGGVYAPGEQGGTSARRRQVGGKSYGA
jgi:hypothetical protein